VCSRSAVRTTEIGEERTEQLGEQVVFVVEVMMHQPGATNASAATRATVAHATRGGSART